MFRGPRNIDILYELDKVVYGHLAAKKALINFINRSKIRYYNKQRNRINSYNNIDSKLLPKSRKLLLMGLSGTGKSALVHALKDIVPIPMLCYDANTFNPTGASGGVKASDIKKDIDTECSFLHNAFNDQYPTIQGCIDQLVVFIDEIDKLGQAFDSSGNWNSHVQSNFLTLFDNKDPNYDGVSYIFAGAFDTLTCNKQYNKLGFSYNNNIDESGRLILDQDIIKFGLIPELVGRLTNIVELDRFTIDDYVTVLTTKLIPAKLLDMQFFNVDEIKLTDQQILEFAKYAYNSGQGIRALQRKLDAYFEDIEFYYEDNKYYLEQL